ncbi:hypothetical protein F511_18582 [Dorcoceras hygrometricum]|uniref:Spindle pole body component 110-like n=1 Tax=Dorcoceras hygrometricum TaxID=472368 RepID=A0A2Z7C7M7_9LAMI|nr:hypothetical protein F511_18582 [Dorcoceras hygrometricum]
MVHEYKKLSQKFKDVKAENKYMKDKSGDSSCSHFDNSDSLETELSKLKTENESLRIKYNELTSENDRLNQVMSSWTKSSVSLGKLHDDLKPFNDKTGLGFRTSESSSSDILTQSDLVNDKLKNMSFVKASVIHDTLESVKYDDQKAKQGIGYTQHENSKPSWLKKLDKDRVRSGKQYSDLNQLRQGSRKLRKHNRPVRGVDTAGGAPGGG